MDLGWLSAVLASGENIAWWFIVFGLLLNAYVMLSKSRIENKAEVIQADATAASQCIDNLERLTSLVARQAETIASLQTEVAVLK